MTGMHSLRQRRAKKARFTAGAFLLLLAFSNNPGSRAEGSQGPSQMDQIKETWGIEPLAVRLTAGGYMLDFRYRVLDPARAAALFHRGIKPVLVDERTGARFIVPAPGKVGPLRTSNPPQVNRTYFILFANPGRFVKPGSEVTVVIGNFKAEKLKVE